MGLFGGKKKLSDEQIAEIEQHFFDETFQEELRNHGRWFFEKIIRENGAVFKQDLDATVAEINTKLQEKIASRLDEAITQVSAELKEHTEKRLDEQFAAFGESVKAVQASSEEALKKSLEEVVSQQKEMLKLVTDSVAAQKDSFETVAKEGQQQIAAVRESQQTALTSLQASVTSLQEQHAKIEETLASTLAAQQDALVGAFKDNMARIVEQYLLSAVGDVYDLKSQLPAIMQQLEDNKQAIVDDMKL